MRIAVDMDEVLADTHAVKRAIFRDRWGYDWTDDQMQGRKLGDLADPLHAMEMEAIQHSGILFANLNPVEDAVAAIGALCEAHEVFIASAGLEYPASCPHKVAWVGRHLPFFDPLKIVFCGDKSVLAVDVLIDDSPRHFDGFRGQGVLFSAPHNAGHDHAPRLDRWADVEALIDDLAGKLAA